MGDHFDISGVFETTEFEITKSACMSNRSDIIHKRRYFTKISLGLGYFYGLFFKLS